MEVPVTILGGFGCFLLLVLIKWIALSQEKEVRANRTVFFGILLGIFVFLVTSILLRGGTLSLKEGSDYRVVSVYKDSVDASHRQNSVVVFATVDEWESYYYFYVPCWNIQNGCPDPWPEHFTDSHNGEKMVIVPMVATPPPPNRKPTKQEKKDIGW